MPLQHQESLLVFSDVHLGSDVDDRFVRAHRSSAIDRDLVAFVLHYANELPERGRWRMVIAGDFIDFIGMTVDPDEAISTEPNEEEREHGLGSASDHARAKLRRVAARHADVFDALGVFLARGHALTIVHGNHDVELHWDEVKADFRKLVIDRALAHGAVEQDLATRIEFNAWFFYWNGVAYIEHGHLYDPYCATEHPMAPLSPLDPRRVARGFTDVLLRYVVRPTRGMFVDGHETLGVVDYVRFGAKLGARGAFALFVRFFRAVVELFRLRRSYVGDAAKALRLEHERRMELLAEATRIGVDRIRALAALQAPPITRSIRGILASVLLDRLALALVAIAMLLITAALGAYHGRFLVASILVLVAWPLAHRELARQRTVDPGDEMLARAGHLARLLPAAFIVMGHTHVPVQRPVADGAATYINLGSWAEDESQSAEYPAPHATRTHLVIQVGDDGPIASLRTWENEGPRPFKTESERNS